jgi:succinoglycan biosynthesis transport protein ExoP
MAQTTTTTTTEQSEGSNSAVLVGRGLLEVAWNRKSLFALGIVVGLLVGLFYFLLEKPIYQSKAQVLVVKKRPDNVTGIDTRQLAIEDYVATHQTLIKSPLIVERAVQKRDLAALESLRDKEELTDEILRSLSVTRNRSAGVNASNVLDLSYRGTNAADSAVVLSAVIDSYKEFLDETYRNISDDTLKLIAKAREVLQQDLVKQEAAYSVFRKEAPVLLVRNKDGASLTQERLSNIESKRSAVLVRKAEVQGYLKAIEVALAKENGHEGLLAMASEWTSRLEGDGYKSTERLSLQNQLYPLLIEEQKLLETRGENHPEVQALRKKISMARTYLAGPGGPWRKIPEKAGVKEVPVEPAEMYRDYFTHQLNHLQVSEKLLADLYKEEFAAVKSLSDYEVEDEKLRRNITITQKLLESIIKKLEDVNFVKDVGGYDARTIAQAALGKKVHPSPLIIFPIALSLGVLFGFGLAYWAELTDKSFRTVEEVRQRLGLAVAGQIPFLQTAPKTRDGPVEKPSPLAPILCAYHQPKSTEAEAYRGLRTALYFSIHGKGHKIIQITSPSSGDGKSTAAANLAITIAQSGKKVLLIDADMRKPTIHKLFGLSAAVGLSSVIIDEAEPKDAIQVNSIPGLSILPCGPIPPNPAELLTSARFEEFLSLLRDQYDFVILDTPPLLAVTDPSVVAHKVDGVFLNLRFTKNGRPDAERAKEILQNLKANVLGVIINDSESILKTSGYGYGYGYGEGYHEKVEAKALSGEPDPSDHASKT